MTRNVLPLLKEGDVCVVENHAVAGSAGFDKNFSEEAVVKFVMAHSVIIEFKNSDNRFDTSRMTFEANGELTQWQNKKVNIQLIVTKGTPEQQKLLDDLMTSVANIGRTKIDAGKFFTQDETTNREFVAQVQAIEDFLNQLYV